jgi:soluble lytic murein transglycosylase-like protein
MPAVPIVVVVAIAIGVALFFFSQPAAASIDMSGGAPAPGPSSSGTTWSPPAAATPYLGAIAEAEARYGLPENLLARQLYQESRYRAEIISGDLRSSAGAIGIAQFLPSTAADFGIDPTDPFASIDAAARYDRQLFDQFGSWDAALAAYNWGQGNVANKGLGAAPRETVAYFSGILGDLGLA